MDQELRRYGKAVPADTVHHIFPAEDYPEYRWSDWNLISLASKTHNEMHDRNTNKLTDKGIELLKRTARKRGISYGREEGCKEESGNEEDNGQEIYTKG